MTTSGTNTFTQVKNQIISLAYSRIGVLSDENQLTAFQIQRGSDLLNIMIKAWIHKGLRLWKISRGVLFLSKNQNSYILDGASANATEDYKETKLFSSALSGASSIVVVSAAGLVSGYNIGILQDNGLFHWTTITTIVGTTIGLTSPLTSAAAANNTIYAYKTKIKRPENIINAQCNIGGNLDISMAMLSRMTYDAIALKYMPGIPNQLYYNKQRDFGEINIFPTASSESYYIKFSFQKQFFDMTNPAEEFDFPNDWLEPLYLGLALKLVGFNSIKDPNFLNDLKTEFAEAMALAKGFDDEDTSIYFYPATDNNQGGYL